MHESYEHPADDRPWAGRRPDWADLGEHQDGHARVSQPTVPPGGAPSEPPDWAGRGRDQAPPTWPPEPSGAAGPSPVGWATQDPYLDRSPGPGHFPGAGPAGWAPPGTCPGHHPSLAGHPMRTVQLWRPAWADYDPYPSHPAWSPHPAYAARNTTLRRLSKLTWRAAELSTVVAVAFAALFARTAQGAASHVSVKPIAKPSAHAVATHPAHNRHKPKRHSHHASSPAAPALAPPGAPPAAPAPPPPPPAPPPAPAPPPPPPPPPPVTTSGGSGGG